MIQNNMVFYFCLRYTRIYFGTQRQFHGHLQRLCNQLTPGHGLLVACTVKLILQISTNYLADAMGNPMIWWYGDIYIYIYILYIYIYTYIYLYIYIYLSLSLHRHVVPMMMSICGHVRCFLGITGLDARTCTNQQSRTQ